MTGARVRSKGETTLAWICVAAWIGAIQAAAGGSFSKNETSRLFDPILLWLFPDASPDFLEAANIALRKAAHVAEYAGLALLALRAFRLSFDRPFKWLAAASFALALAVAAIDEARQSTEAERDGTLADVALDAGGAASALALAGAVRRYRSVPP